MDMTLNSPPSSPPTSLDGLFRSNRPPTRTYSKRFARPSKRRKEVHEEYSEPQSLARELEVSDEAVIAVQGTEDSTHDIRSEKAAAPQAARLRSPEPPSPRDPPLPLRSRIASGGVPDQFSSTGEYQALAPEVSTLASVAGETGSERATDDPPQQPLTPSRSKSRLAGVAEIGLTPQRNLGELFATVSPSRSPALANILHPSQSPGRSGGRKMLTKSQSLGHSQSSRLYDNSPSGSAVPEAGPSTPSRTIRKTSTMAHTNLDEPSSPTPFRFSTAVSSSPELPISGGKAKRTYGRSRSMYDLATGQQPFDADREEPTESYADLRKRYEVDTVSASPGAGNLLQALVNARAPLPVTDLRSRGGNRRFFDELGVTLDTIEDSRVPLNVRTATLIECLAESSDLGWLAKVKTAGQFERMVTAVLAISASNDILLKAALLFFIQLQGADELTEPIQTRLSSALISLIVRGLRYQGVDSVPDVDAALTPELQNMATKILETGDKIHPPWLSSRLAAGLCTDACWPSIKIAALEQGLLVAMSRSLARELQPFSNGDIGSEALLDNNVNCDSVSDHIQHCTRGISFMLNSLDGRTMQSIADQSKPAESLLSSLPTMAMLALHKKLSSPSAALALYEASKLLAQSTEIWVGRAWASISAEILSCTLMRILLQRRRLVSRAVAMETAGIQAQPGIGNEDREDELLCVVLAICLDLAREDSDFAVTLLRSEISETCIGSDGCVKECHCACQEPSARHLITLYEKCRVAEREDLQLVSGYVALLLGMGMVAEDSTRQLVFECLVDNTPCDWVDQLVETLDSLHQVQSVANRKLLQIFDDGLEDKDRVALSASDSLTVIATVIEGLRQARRTL